MIKDRSIIQEFKWPHKMEFYEPDIGLAWEKVGQFYGPTEMSQKRWVSKANNGVPVKINDIGGVEVIEDRFVNLKSCIEFLLLKEYDQFRTGMVPYPTLLKRDEGIYCLEGKERISFFQEFDKLDELQVWLVDDSRTSTQGDITKNVADGTILPVYNYGNITEDDKTLVREVIGMLDADKAFKTSQLLKERFKMNDVIQYDRDESVFLRYANEMNLPVHIQGHSTQTKGNETRHYPIFSICDDIRILNKFVENIIKDTAKKIAEAKAKAFTENNRDVSNDPFKGTSIEGKD
jgi:hypothetical protein